MNTQLVQHSLFNDQPHAVMAETKPDPMEERKAAMDAAFEHADERFKEEYLRLVMRFVAEGREFTGEDVQNEYRKRSYLPQPREWRSVGSMYQKLIRQGVIIRVGYGKRNQGNLTSIYRGAKHAV